MIEPKDYLEYIVKGLVDNPDDVKVEKTIDEHFLIKFDYPEMNIVMRIIKEEKLSILNQKMELNCEFKLAVRKKDATRIFDLFQNTYKVLIKKP